MVVALGKIENMLRSIKVITMKAMKRVPVLAAFLFVNNVKMVVPSLGFKKGLCLYMTEVGNLKIIYRNVKAIGQKINKEINMAIKYVNKKDAVEKIIFFISLSSVFLLLLLCI